MSDSNQTALRSMDADQLDTHCGSMRVGQVKQLNSASESGDQHLIAIIKTDQEGINSGRPRFFVACVTCEKLLHEATTSISAQIRQHMALSLVFSSLDEKARERERGLNDRVKLLSDALLEVLEDIDSDTLVRIDAERAAELRKLATL